VNPRRLHVTRPDEPHLLGKFKNFLFSIHGLPLCHFLGKYKQLPRKCNNNPTPMLDNKPRIMYIEFHLQRFRIHQLLKSDQPIPMVNCEESEIDYGVMPLEGL